MVYQAAYCNIILQGERPLSNICYVRKVGKVPRGWSKVLLLLHKCSMGDLRRLTVVHE